MKFIAQPFVQLIWRTPELRRNALICVALALVSAAAEIAVTVSLVPVLASLGVAAGGGLATFVSSAPPHVWLLLFAVAMALRSATLWATAVSEERGTQDLVVALQTRLFRALASAHWDTVRRITPPTITSALQTQTYEAGYGFSAIVGISSATLLAIGYLLSTVFLLPLLLPLLTGLLLLMWWLNARRNRKVQAQSVDYYDAQTDLHQQYEDWVAVSRIASLGVDTAGLSDRFAASAREAAAHSVAYSRTAAATSISYQAAVVAAILIGVPVAWQLDTPPALLAFGIVAVARLLPRAGMIQRGYQGLINAVAPFAGIEALVDKLSQDQNVSSAAGPPDWQMLELVGVGVRERPGDPQSRWILRNIRLQFGLGEWLALTGPTGAGKTTLAEVLLTLVRPGAGRLLLDGQAMDDELASRWRKQVAYVPQDVILFDGTIRDNLRVYAATATDSELHDALQQAAADFVFERLPEGLDTRTGPGGRWLSGGERQRIGIARALLHRPGLLVLDEPTAALDVETQETLMRALEKLSHSMSVVLITHRPELERLADRVIALDDGEVVRP